MWQALYPLSGVKYCSCPLFGAHRGAWGVRKVLSIEGCHICQSISLTLESALFRRPNKHKCRRMDVRPPVLHGGCPGERNLGGRPFPTITAAEDDGRENAQRGIRTCPLQRMNAAVARARALSLRGLWYVPSHEPQRPAGSTPRSSLQRHRPCGHSGTCMMQAASRLSSFSWQHLHQPCVDGKV